MSYCYIACGDCGAELFDEKRKATFYCDPCWEIRRDGGKKLQADRDDLRRRLARLGDLLTEAEKAGFHPNWPFRGEVIAEARSLLQLDQPPGGT